MFLKAVRVQAVALKLQVACSCSTQDYEVHLCHCKQFEDQVKQLEKEVAESKGEACSRTE